MTLHGFRIDLYPLVGDFIEFDSSDIVPNTKSFGTVVDVDDTHVLCGNGLCVELCKVERVNGVGYKHEPS